MTQTAKPTAEFDRTYATPGRSVPGFIAADPGLHGGVAFDYRPFTPIDLAMLRDKTSKIPGEVDSLKIVAKAVAERITSWDLADEHGPVPATTENLLRLAPTLHAKLILLVQGFRASDPMPTAEQPEQGEPAEQQPMAPLFQPN